MQAKDIAANLSHCDADIVAACSWIKDEYEPTIEVRQISKVRIDVRKILRPAWLTTKHSWTALKFAKEKKLQTAGKYWENIYTSWTLENIL